LTVYGAIMKAKTQAYLELAACQLGVGANIAVMKLVAPLMPVYIQLELRFFLSTVILGLFQWLWARDRFVREEEPNQRITRHEWMCMAIMGALGGVFFNLFMMEGIKMTSAMSAGIIVSTTPAFLALFSFIFLKEVLTKPKLIALMLAIAGIVILNWDMATDDWGGEGGIGLWGVLLVFLSTIPEAMYTIVSKFLGNRLRPISVAFFVNAVNIVYFAPFAIYQYQTQGADFANLQVWGLTVLVALASLQFYILWQRGIQHVTGSTAALFIGLMPVGATLTSVFYLGEDFGIYEAGGMLAVLLAILVGSAGKRSPAATMA